MRGIQIEKVTKSFGELVVLENVSTQIQPGVIYGLLGRNGVGKTTLLNLIANRLYVDSGSIELDGAQTMDNDEALGQMYYMSTQNLYPETMKVKEAFDWTEHFYQNFDREEAVRLAGEFQLPLNKKIKDLSTGMGSIFKLIVAMATNAPYLLLDEPVLGLDANNRHAIYRCLLEKYAENGCSIVLSTHIIEEVSGVIEDVIILHEQKVLKDTSVEHLLETHYKVAGPQGEVEEYLRGKELIQMQKLGGLRIAIIEGAPDSPGGNLSIEPVDLQELFVALTQNEQGI